MQQIERAPICYDAQRYLNKNATLPSRWQIFKLYLVNPDFRVVYFYRKRREHLVRKHRIRYAYWAFFNNLIFKAIAISSSADFGPGLMIIHAFGTAIGAARVGSNCTLRHNITIGAKMDKLTREICYPVLGNNIWIAPGAVLLGKITIGNNVVIGANSVVLDSFSDECVIAGIPAKIVGKYYDKERYR